MVISMYRLDLPEWVKQNMQMTCPYCGSFILDNSDTGSTTARWCANPVCPGHMKYKMAFVAKYFGISNFGVETAYSYIKGNNCQCHLDILKKWFPDDKPLVSLSEVAILACIEGYSETQARQELNKYGSFESYFANLAAANPILRKNYEYLMKCQSYFAIKPALSSRIMRVMGTGSFHGFSNRDEFFSKVNAAYGNMIQVIQTGKRKTGVSYLIKEHDAVDHSKSQIAREEGIPIVTPKEFVDILDRLCSYTCEET